MRRGGAVLGGLVGPSQACCSLGAAPAPLPLVSSFPPRRPPFNQACFPLVPPPSSPPRRQRQHPRHRRAAGCVGGGPRWVRQQAVPCAGPHPAGGAPFLQGGSTVERHCGCVGGAGTGWLCCWQAVRNGGEAGRWRRDAWGMGERLGQCPASPGRPAPPPPPPPPTDFYAEQYGVGGHRDSALRMLDVALSAPEEDVKVRGSCAPPPPPPNHPPERDLRCALCIPDCRPVPGRGSSAAAARGVGLAEGSSYVEVLGVRTTSADRLGELLGVGAGAAGVLPARARCGGSCLQAPRCALPPPHPIPPHTPHPRCWWLTTVPPGWAPAATPSAASTGWSQRQTTGTPTCRWDPGVKARAALASPQQTAHERVFVVLPEPLATALAGAAEGTTVHGSGGRGGGVQRCVSPSRPQLAHASPSFASSFAVQEALEMMAAQGLHLPLVLFGHMHSQLKGGWVPPCRACGGGGGRASGEGTPAAQAGPCP